MKKLSLLALITAMALAIALAGCGGGGGGGTPASGGNNGGIDNPPPAPDDSGTGGSGTVTGTRIIGKIIRSTDHASVANVTVTFGKNPTTGAALTAKSGSTGAFAINVPADTTILSLFPPDSVKFAVSTAGLSGYDSNSGVSYDNNGDGIYESYPSNAIPVSFGVLEGTTTNLGNIILAYQGSGSSDSGGSNDNPPDVPPGF